MSTPGGSTLPGTHAFVSGDNGVFLFKASPSTWSARGP